MAHVLIAVVVGVQAQPVHQASQEDLEIQDHQEAPVNPVPHLILCVPLKPSLLAVNAQEVIPGHRDHPGHLASQDRQGSPAEVAGTQLKGLPAHQGQMASQDPPVSQDRQDNLDSLDSRAAARARLDQRETTALQDSQARQDNQELQDSQEDQGQRDPQEDPASPEATASQAIPVKTDSQEAEAIAESAPSTAPRTEESSSRTESAVAARPMESGPRTEHYTPNISIYSDISIVLLQLLLVEAGHSLP